MTTLYINTHNITGLKYFGKTVKTGKQFESYKGSGDYWLRHLKKHGTDISKEIFAQFEDNDPDLVETALKFSEDNDIVNSKEWANLIPENGLDGTPPGTYGSRNGLKNSDLHRKRISEALKGVKRSPLSENQRKKISSSLIGNVLTAEHKGKISLSHSGKVLSTDHKNKLSISHLGRNK